MNLSQNDFEIIKDLRHKGEITLDQAHVMMVTMRRVLLVTSSLPADVRRALNAAVKTKQLAHLKKDGHKPEVYYHPNFDHLARDDRSKYERMVFSALSKTIARPIEF